CCAKDSGRPSRAPSPDSGRQSPARPTAATIGRTVRPRPARRQLPPTRPWREAVPRGPTGWPAMGRPWARRAPKMLPAQLVTTVYDAVEAGEYEVLADDDRALACRRRRY